MEIRIETKKAGKVVLQVLAAPGVADGDLAAMLESAVMDLHWNVVKDAETIYPPPPGGNHQVHCAGR